MLAFRKILSRNSSRIGKKYVHKNHRESLVEKHSRTGCLLHRREIHTFELMPETSGNETGNKDLEQLVLFHEFYCSHELIIKGHDGKTLSLTT